MALRPGKRFDMSSHFIPLPLKSMIKASSSGDHLLCFLAGVSDGCGGMLRFPPVPPGCAVANGGTLEAAVTGRRGDALVAVA